MLGWDARIAAPERKQAAYQHPAPYILEEDIQEGPGTGGGLALALGVPWSWLIWSYFAQTRATNPFCPHLAIWQVLQFNNSPDRFTPRPAVVALTPATSCIELVRLPLNCPKSAQLWSPAGQHSRRTHRQQSVGTQFDRSRMPG